ncbi:MAG: hypothetical protein IAE91_12725 [Ignavibacteriaceae bacterium]|nr:hypothetical protein [Ignavibacteriaceae bacterium]
MKKIRKYIAICLLIIYIAASVEIVFPYLQHIVFFEYIVTQLCEQKDEPVNLCGGECYKSKKLIETAERQTEKKERKEVKNELSVHFPQYFNFLPSRFYNYQKVFVANLFIYDTPLEILTPPPKV